MRTTLPPRVRTLQLCEAQKESWHELGAPSYSAACCPQGHHLSFIALKVGYRQFKGKQKQNIVCATGSARQQATFVTLSDSIM